MHKNSILLFKKYASKYFKENMKVLEIGPDHIPSIYQKSIKRKAIIWDTLDIEPRENLVYVANDEYSFPIKDNYYDIIFSGQVIEHVKKLWIWIKEISRICKTGGIIITINPISWPFHKAPYDCWRIYPEGMKALYEEGGLLVKLSLFESLESIYIKKNGFWNIIPGKTAPQEAYWSFSEFIKYSIKNIKKPKVVVTSIIKYCKMLIGWPITCSIDTITIGIKKSKY